MPYPCVFVSLNDDMKGRRRGGKSEREEGEGKKKQFDLRR